MFLLRAILIIHYMPWIVTGMMLWAAWYLGRLGYRKWRDWQVAEAHYAAFLANEADRHNAAYQRGDEDTYGDYAPYTTPLTNPVYFSKDYDEPYEDGLTHWIAH